MYSVCTSSENLNGQDRDQLDLTICRRPLAMSRVRFNRSFHTSTTVCKWYISVCTCMYSRCTSMYLIQTSIYKYLLSVYLYIPGCTALCPVLLDFVEHCVMQTHGCQMSGSSLQIRTLTRVVTKIPARRMKNVFNRGRMLRPWKRRSASLWMAWRHRNAVASRT
jgi:hypothetical protein